MQQVSSSDTKLFNHKEVPFCSCRLFFSFIRGAMNQVSSFGILNKQDQELSLHNVSVYLVVKMNVQISVSAANSQEISIYFNKYLFGQNKYFLAYFWVENKYILA